MESNPDICQEEILFKSRVWRRPLEPDEDTSNNRRFKTHRFIPSDFENQENKHLVIMVNGMGEFNKKVYFGSNGLCARFAGIGVATWFLPLPFHFTRLSKQDEEALEIELKRWIKEARNAKKENRPLPNFNHPTVVKNINRKSRFYLGYNQLLDDLDLISDLINDDIKAGNLPSDIKISLWGFSIGGLGVLGRFLEKPDVYHACILAHSGAGFETLGYYNLIMSEADWEDIRDFWHEIAEGLERGDDSVLEKFEEIKSVRYDDIEKFGMVFLDLHKDKFLELTKANSHKLLVFVGGQDNVVPLESVISSLVPEAGLAIHTLPGLQHDVHNAKTWLDYETQVVKAFLNYHPLSN